MCRSPMGFKNRVNSTGWSKQSMISNSPRERERQQRQRERESEEQPASSRWSASNKVLERERGRSLRRYDLRKKPTHQRDNGERGIRYLPAGGPTIRKPTSLQICRSHRSGMVTVRDESKSEKEEEPAADWWLWEGGTARERKCDSNERDLTISGAPQGWNWWDSSELGLLPASKNERDLARRVLSISKSLWAFK